MVSSKEIMTIQFIGHSFFKITGKDAVIATDPFPKEIGLEPQRFKADILTISHQHWDHNNKKAILGEPFIAETPGEYDVKSVFIRGIRSFHDNKQGKERGENTIFIFQVEDIQIAHLGDFGQKELSQEQLEALEAIDILLVPVGGVYTINAKEAHQLILKLEPKIVIPMHFKVPGLKITEIAPVSEFLKEMGFENIEPQERLTIKRGELPQEIEVVYLKPLSLKS